jgi:hypothetical protein
MSGLLAWHVSDTLDNDAPLTEEQVRSTVEPIRDDGEKAEAQHAPEWNELDTDESDELVGLSPRVVGSDVHDSKQYAPWWADMASDPHNIIVDRQVASSGTAAAREMQGEQGHGTMEYEVGIEPAIRAGAAFGNDYFLSNPAQIQEGAGAYMTPLGDDNFANAIAQSNATRNSRTAYNDSLFADFLG